MRKVAIAASARLVLVVVLSGCPSSSAGSAPGPDSGSASGSGSGSASASGPGSASGSDAGIGPAEGYLADAGAAAPYVSKEGRFAVSVPSGIKPNETTGGVGWKLGGAALVVGYYDGKPHGVDRSRFYDLARDKVGGSEVEREDDVKLGGFPTRMRRIRLVLVNKPVQWRRSAIIVAGDRTYEISCTSTAPADLDAAPTNAFFDSFKIAGAAK